jgi:hypothetical protein
MSLLGATNDEVKNLQTRYNDAIDELNSVNKSYQELQLLFPRVINTDCQIQYGVCQTTCVEGSCLEECADTYAACTSAISDVLTLDRPFYCQ